MSRSERISRLETLCHQLFVSKINDEAMVYISQAIGHLNRRHRAKADQKLIKALEILRNL